MYGVRLLERFCPAPLSRLEGGSRSVAPSTVARDTFPSPRFVQLPEPNLFSRDSNLHAYTAHDACYDRPQVCAQPEQSLLLFSTLTDILHSSSSSSPHRHARECDRPQLIITPRAINSHPLTRPSRLHLPRRDNRSTTLPNA